MIYNNQAELDAGLAYWQNVLRLGDWEVKAKIVRARDMVPEGALAGCCRYTYHKQAIVRLCDPLDFGNFPDWEFDHEADLVHELLHLQVEEVGDPIYEADEKLWDSIDRAKERLINNLARALVALNRK